jgi:hypothetical protein|tara:strand:- start:292 stop:471 length:180 start_codon:yes stop_codon:yes gene_type:complete
MRNSKGSTVRSNYQLGCEITQLSRWFINLNERLEVLGKHLNHPPPEPDKKIGLEEFVED